MTDGRAAGDVGDVGFARDLWVRIETLHAVTYFAPEVHEAARDAGLKGFWMGYFGFRAAPMGRVAAGVVDATFANFAPTMVERAIPDAWSFADPADLVDARASAVASALRRAAPGLDHVAVEVNEPLEAIVSAATPLGRPLFAANAAMAPRSDPVERLWQNCTTLREHRGDGHVAALALAGLSGCQVHLMLAAELEQPAEVFIQHRGWSVDDVADAVTRLEARGLLVDGRLTEAGSELRAGVERTTDELAAAPVTAALNPDERRSLLDALTPPAAAVLDAGDIPFPNPMGLPRLSH
ncbi:MAG: hypothetical protein AAF456_04195 [Planctomycetota bacterium]